MASYVAGGQLPTFRHSQAVSETALLQSAVCMGGLLAAKLVQNYLMPAPQGYDGRLADEELLRLYWPFMVSGVQNILRI
jgi:hypothetical protein